jgi:hypothetical protein
MGNTYELSKVFFERIPIKQPTASEAELCDKLVTLVQHAKRQSALHAAAVFLEEVIDLCVAEFYFDKELLAQELDIISFVTEILAGYDPNAPQVNHSEWVQRFFEIANHPKHSIRNRLLRRAIGSPDILGVMLREGAV